MKRFDNWDVRLADFVASRRDTQFKWGEHDCALFACDAIREMTGEDLAHDFRGKYTTVKEAAIAIRGITRGDLEGLTAYRCAEFGLSEVPTALAQRGDVVVILNGAHKALGIVSGSTAFATGLTGLTLVPRSSWLRAWRVG